MRYFLRSGYVPQNTEPTYFSYVPEKYGLVLVATQPITH